MAKYAYKLDYDNSLFLNKLKQFGGNLITKSECSSDSMTIIEADSSIKNDLDEYMNSLGYSYSFETDKNITNTKNWGIMQASGLPTLEVNTGDYIYCSDTKKPLWWDGSKWVDAAGN